MERCIVQDKERLQLSTACDEMMLEVELQAYRRPEDKTRAVQSLVEIVVGSGNRTHHK